MRTNPYLFSERTGLRKHLHIMHWSFAFLSGKELKIFEKVFDRKY